MIPQLQGTTPQELQRWAVQLVQELDRLQRQVAALEKKLTVKVDAPLYNEQGGLTLRVFAAAAGGTPAQGYADSAVERRDWAIYLFSGDPTRSRQGPGLYRWSAAKGTWLKV